MQRNNIQERVRCIAQQLAFGEPVISATFPHLLKEGGGERKEGGGATVKDTDLAGFIDHTLLKPQAKQVEIEELCREAAQHRFKAVCVNGAYAALARAHTHAHAAASGQEPTQLAVVVGFPLGCCTTHIKVAEAVQAISLGANEIDMVLNVGWLKDGPEKYKSLFDEISGVVTAVGKAGLVKVILETALLTDEEIVDACVICAFAGAHFVKTSTGFATVPAGKASGATIEHVKLMRSVVGDRMGVKASGGVRTHADARAMIAAGASRIGTSNGIAIVQGSQSTNAY